MGPLPSRMKLPLGPNHATKLNLGPYRVPPHFALFSAGRHFSGQAGMELVCTLPDFPVRQLGHQDARDHYAVQQSASHTAIKTDEYYKKLGSSLRAIIINSH